MSDSQFPLTAKVMAELETPEAYLGDASAPAGIERLQTHISYLFLTADRVYKFRRDVDLGFVCFRTREERNADCLREVALNRRLAPDVYLGVAPLIFSGGCARIGELGEELFRGADGEAAEHCVVMRRLAAGGDALRLLETGSLSVTQLDPVAALVARFHDASGLGAPAPFTREQWQERCRKPSEDCYRQLLAPETAEPLRSASRLALGRTREVARSLEDSFERRRVSGLAVDAHGDMHLEHIWFEPGAPLPVIIDCLEFNSELRQIDAASEVAFTAMDLRYRDAPRLAEHYLRVYARERDDFGLYDVVDYFLSYRAAVRAKIAAIAASDPVMDKGRRERAYESALRHVELASRALDCADSGHLVLVGGAVGSGKTSVAEAVADAVSGVVISTDRVRKRRAGLPASARPGEQQTSQLYSGEEKHAVYQAVVERARPVLLSGRTAVLDGTFSRREDRELARALAADTGAGCFFLEARCAPEVAIARLEQRSREGRDASDAGPERHRPSLQEFADLRDWPQQRRAVVRTDAKDWRSSLPETLAGLAGAAEWSRRL
jgi:aminoglycoside phosphotransferase family enzyme/predicted kinase